MLFRRVVKKLSDFFFLNLFFVCFSPLCSGVFLNVIHYSNRMEILLYSVLFCFILLEADEENPTGDVQVLCQMFSGEEALYRYATEHIEKLDLTHCFAAWVQHKPCSLLSWLPFLIKDTVY